MPIKVSYEGPIAPSLDAIYRGARGQERQRRSEQRARIGAQYAAIESRERMHMQDLMARNYFNQQQMAFQWADREDRQKAAFELADQNADAAMDRIKQTQQMMDARQKNQFAMQAAADADREERKQRTAIFEGDLVAAKKMEQAAMQRIGAANLTKGQQDALEAYHKKMKILESKRDDIKPQEYVDNYSEYINELDDIADSIGPDQAKVSPQDAWNAGKINGANNEEIWMDPEKGPRQITSPPPAAKPPPSYMESSRVYRSGMSIPGLPVDENAVRAKMFIDGYESMDPSARTMEQDALYADAQNAVAQWEAKKEWHQYDKKLEDYWTKVDNIASNILRSSPQATEGGGGAMSYEQAEQKAIERLENRGIYAPETPEADDPRRRGRTGRTAAPAATSAAPATAPTASNLPARISAMSIDEAKESAGQIVADNPNPASMAPEKKQELLLLYRRLAKGK